MPQNWGKVTLVKHADIGTVEGEPSMATHEPIAEPEPPLASSEAVDRPGPRRRPALTTILTVAAVAVLAALTGWALIGPGSPSSNMDMSSVIDVPDSIDPAQAPASPSGRPEPTAAPAPATAVPSVAQAAPPPAPQPVASPEADAAFLAAVKKAGIVTNPASALGVAHKVCGLMSQGNTESSIVAAIIKRNPRFTNANGEGFVNAAVATYCPQYKGQLGM